MSEQERKELSVVVEQTTGTIKWNFEEIKTALREKMTEYANVVYTDDKVQDAKTDVADLRKLRKAVEDRRKEIKTRCLEPYAVIEAQAKELVALIDEPIGKIAAQVNAYEAQKREQTKGEITEYMKEVFKGLPSDIAERLMFKVYDERWLNVSTSKKTWRTAIDEAGKKASEEWAILMDTEEEFRQAAVDVYKRNLDFTGALNKVRELRRQKELILEAERRRQEEAKRREAEAEARRREEAERRAREAEAKRQADALKLLNDAAKRSEELGEELGYADRAKTDAYVQTNYARDLEQARNADAGQTIVIPEAADGFSSVNEEKDGEQPERSYTAEMEANAPAEEPVEKGGTLVRVYAEGSVLKKILAYIAYTGTRYEVEEG